MFVSSKLDKAYKTPILVPEIFKFLIDAIKIITVTIFSRDVVNFQNQKFFLSVAWFKSITRSE